MALMKTLLYMASGFYFITVILLLYYLPSLSKLKKSGYEGPIIHSHVIAERTAESICLNLTQTENQKKSLRLTPLNSKVYLLSAYYDKRLSQVHYIRVLVLVASSYKPDINLHCHISVDHDRFFTVPAILYEFNENHNQEFGGFIFSCPLPHNLAAELPVCTVKITDGSSYKGNGANMLLKEIQAKHNLRYNFTVCIPPIHGPRSPERLIEFFEMNRLLGAQQFYIYTLAGSQINPQTTDILNYYQSKHLVTQLSWHLPVSPSEIWYHGQTLLIHHCLFSNMMLSQYTVFQDLDELIIPRQHATWSHMMASLDKGTQCGFRFYSVFFDPFLKRNSQNLVSLNSQIRTKEVSRFRTKCIVHPKLIFEMGIHHISKQNIEDITPENVNEVFALVHHYRECDTAFSMNCNEKINDSIMDKYRKPLLSRFLKTRNQINEMFNWTKVS